MSAGWAAAIAAAASMASGMYASNQAGKEGDKAYIRTRDLMKAQQQFQKSQLERAMEYDTQMANTAHQREVADLKAAGLNPILSSGGTGAVSPTIQGGGAPGSPTIGVNNSKIEAMMNLAQLSMQNRAVRVQEKNQASEQMVNQEKVQTMKSEQGLNNANAELAVANKLYKNAELKWLPERVKQELRESASRISLNSASSVKALAEGNLANIGSTVKQQEALAIEAERKLKEQELAGKEVESEWNKKHPIQSEITYGLSRWTGAVGNVFNGGVHAGYGKTNVTKRNR